MQRVYVKTLLARLREPRHHIQVLAGPRQVGKTTVAEQAAASWGGPTWFASADGPIPPDHGWIERQWDLASRLAGDGLLILDEVQKIPRWSEVVKARWDEDSRSRCGLRVVLLGSAPLLVARGLTESLAGRFEIIRLAQWSWPEMHEAFGWDLDTYLTYGGYPGAASLIGDERRWAAYIRDALVETTVSRDVLLMNRVDKPALLRQLADLAFAYSGQALSYTKMLGTLHDAGNTTTLAHYLDLLRGAGLVSGLQKFAGDVARRRGSSPKLCVHDTALITSRPGMRPSAWRDDPELWGRLVESAVGAHLVRTATEDGLEVAWWRDGSDQVGFVVFAGDRATAIEVKSTHAAPTRGLDAFRAHFPRARTLQVGPGALDLATFFAEPAAAWL
jgi:hypothetical protein